mgnify:CR=1 FL=1
MISSIRFFSEDRTRIRVKLTRDRKPEGLCKAQHIERISICDQFQLFLIVFCLNTRKGGKSAKIKR